MINFSTKRVGGFRFFKIGRVNISVSVSREYRPLPNADRLHIARSFGMLAAFYVAFMALALLIVPSVAHAGEPAYVLLAQHAETDGINAYALDTGLTYDDCTSAIDHIGATVQLMPAIAVSRHAVTLSCQPSTIIVDGQENDGN